VVVAWVVVAVVGAGADVAVVVAGASVVASVSASVAASVVVAAVVAGAAVVVVVWTLGLPQADNTMINARNNAVKLIGFMLILPNLLVCADYRDKRLFDSGRLIYGSAVSL